MTKDETLTSALEVLDEFYKDTAVMLKTLKGIFISEFSYKDLYPGSGACRDNSASLDFPIKWTTPYLSLPLHKDEEYISVIITLKDYWGNLKPKKEFSIYGIKFHNVIEPHRNNKLSWLGRVSAEAPDEAFKRTYISGYTVVENLEHFSSCKFIKRSLWDMKDRQAVADFAKSVVELQ